MSKSNEIENEIAYQIVKRVINDIINNPEKYGASAVKFATLAETVGFKNIEYSWLDKIVEQKWSIEDIKVNSVSSSGNSMIIWVEVPNGYTAQIRATTKEVYDLNKDEYLKFKQLYDSLMAKHTISELKQKIEKKNNEIKSLMKEIEELRLEKRKVEEYCEEKRKEYDITYEDARNMLSFLNEKGLIDEYIDWLNKRDKEEIKAKMMSYYGLIENDDYDDDC